jgi:hypothetical protein
MADLTDPYNRIPSTVPWWTGLVELGASRELIDWAKTQSGAAVAWATCERGDWMLWWAGRLAGPPGDDRRLLVLAACDCAVLALPLFESKYPSDARPRVAIDTARAWAHGKATPDQVNAAAAAAASAYAAAAAYAAASAAYAAASAATATATAYAAAAYAASAVASAVASAAAADAERSRVLRECADIARRHYPKPPELP